MIASSFQRKSTAHVKVWQSDYLVHQRLHGALIEYCPRLHGRTLDLGCGNSPYRPLLTNISDYVAYDLDSVGGKPAVVGIAGALPFADASFDSVLSTQVIEHVPEPWHMVEEIGRVLRPGGMLLLSAPQAWRVHEAPHDYYRYTTYGLSHLLERAGLESLVVQSQGGAWALIGQQLNNMLWREQSPKYSLNWASRMLRTLALNLVCDLLDRRDLDVADTLNHVVLASKR